MSKITLVLQDKNGEMKFLHAPHVIIGKDPKAALPDTLKLPDLKFAFDERGNPVLGTKPKIVFDYVGFLQMTHPKDGTIYMLYREREAA